VSVSKSLGWISLFFSRVCRRWKKEVKEDRIELLIDGGGSEVHNLLINLRP